MGLRPHRGGAQQQGGLTVGVLANQIWSVAGPSDRREVSSTFLHPFLAYTTHAATTFSLNTESSYDWVTGQWTVPVNLTVAQLFRPSEFGLPIPLQVQVGYRYLRRQAGGRPDRRRAVQPHRPIAEAGRPARIPDHSRCVSSMEAAERHFHVHRGRILSTPPGRLNCLASISPHRAGANSAMRRWTPTSIRCATTRGNKAARGRGGSKIGGRQRGGVGVRLGSNPAASVIPESGRRQGWNRVPGRAYPANARAAASVFRPASELINLFGQVFGFCERQPVPGIQPLHGDRGKRRGQTVAALPPQPVVAPRVFVRVLPPLS